MWAIDLSNKSNEGAIYPLGQSTIPMKFMKKTQQVILQNIPIFFMKPREMPSGPGHL